MEPSIRLERCLVWHDTRSRTSVDIFAAAESWFLAEQQQYGNSSSNCGSSSKHRTVDRSRSRTRLGCHASASARRGLGIPALVRALGTSAAV